MPFNYANPRYRLPSERVISIAYNHLHVDLIMMNSITPQTDSSNVQRNRLHKYLIVSLFLLAVTVRMLPGPRTIDDSYITYRYARNILAGNGFVYNPDERVLGTTTPFYTILLTVLGSVTGGVNAPFPTIAMSVNAFADGMVCIFLFLLGRKLRSPIAGFGAGCAWAVAPYSVTFSIGGLETSVFVLNRFRCLLLSCRPLYSRCIPFSAGCINPA